MLREAYHPKAYLASIKNMKLGLRARTRILDVLEKLSVDAKSVAKNAGMSYAGVMHHLKLLEAEGIVNRKGGKPYVWTLTGLGQRRLANSV
jgi:DNA-binding transcriptional ArsR family regulator